MEIKNYFAQDASGNVMPGARVDVFFPGTTSPVTTLQNAEGGAKANPFFADAKGLIQFAAPNGLYDLKVTSGMTSYTIKIQCADLSDFVGDAQTAASMAEDEADRAEQAANSMTYSGTGAGGTVEDYAAGIEVTAYNQIIRADGEFWKLTAANDLPYTTTGAGMPEGGAFVSVGDAALRQSLANPTDPALGAAIVGYKTENVTKVLSEMKQDPTITDVFVVYGQSNAKGSALATPGRETVTSRARYWSTINQDLRPVIYDMDYTASFTALLSSGHAWGAFANRYTQLTGRKIVIVPSAVGGTSIAQLSKGDASNIYSDMLAEFNKAIAALALEGVTVGSINCIFHQGETDQSDGTTYDTYVTAMDTLFTNMATDLGIERFYVALVGNPQSRPEISWHRIRTAQQFVSDDRADSTVVFSEFAGFLQSNGLLRSDGVHATQVGYNVMGSAIAESVATEKQIGLSRGTRYLDQASAVDVVNGARVRQVSCAIRLTSAGAELLTRDNNSRHISSMVDAITLSSAEIFIRCNALRSHKVYGMNVAVVDENLPGSMIDASVISTLVDTNKIGFRVRLSTNQTFVVNTDSGSISQNAQGDALKYHTSASLSISGGTGFWAIAHNTGAYTPLFSRVKTTGTPILDTVGLQPTIVSGGEFRLPTSAGLIAASIPSHTIRPNALPVGASILVSFDALVASPRV